jgi:hypothetical protein
METEVHLESDEGGSRHARAALSGVMIDARMHREIVFIIKHHSMSDDECGMTLHFPISNAHMVLVHIRCAHALRDLGERARGNLILQTPPATRAMRACLDLRITKCMKKIMRINGDKTTLTFRMRRFIRLTARISQ